jgi:6-phosphogluconolactonase
LRVSLSFASIRTSQEVWLITAGTGKAAAVALALGGAGEVEIPAAGARGRQRTLWLLDEAAASQLPRAVFRTASS